MGRLISSLNITPDGFCNHTDVIADDELHAFAANMLRNADVVLFGRITYQLFENYWPLALKDHSLSESEMEFAQLIDKAEKVVVTRSLQNVQWRNTTVLQDLNIEILQDLKQRTKKDILIFGSPGLVSELTKLDLIDNYYFLVQPILSGKGKRLFEIQNLDKRQNLKLTDKIFFQSGVTTLCYQKIEGIKK